MTKDAIEILDNAIDNIDHIDHMLLELETYLKKQIQDENIVEPSGLLFGSGSIASRLLNNLRYDQLNIIYPNTLWSSLFLTIYGIFESTLDILSDYFFENNNLSFSPKELNYKGISRSEIYLKKMVGINFRSDLEQWESIKESADIRHCIIHANGIVNQYNKGNVINSLVEKYPGISVEHNHLIIKKQFIESFISWCRVIFIQLRSG
jgi:hypothetical protein